MALEFPSRSEVDKAPYEQLRSWYNELPTPTNDIEYRILARISKRLWEHEANAGESRGGCVFVLFLVIALSLFEVIK